jgi:hypothetical protein
MATAKKKFVAIRQKFGFFGSQRKESKLHKALSRARARSQTEERGEEREWDEWGRRGNVDPLFFVRPPPSHSPSFPRSSLKKTKTKFYI